MQYCEVNKQHPLKADQVWFFRFLTYITMHYSASSVKVAASAVVEAPDDGVSAMIMII